MQVPRKLHGMRSLPPQFTQKSVVRTDVACRTRARRTRTRSRPELAHGVLRLEKKYRPNSPRFPVLSRRSGLTPMGRVR